MKITKKVVAVFGVVAIIVLGIIAIPTKVDAEEVTVGNIVYDNSYEMASFWSADGEKSAPTKEGYVFGGWYERTGDKEFQALTTSSTEAYAKFVPSYVLSVRAQLEKETETKKTEKASTFLRVITGVDSTKYQHVGFDIWYNKTIKEEDEQEQTVITKVYKSMTNGEGTITPSETFGEAATHFGVLKIADIANSNYEKVIYVRPYWTTLDGTRVEGLAKYVRVMDGYADNKYISVPINLLVGNAVAAGVVEMTYDKRLEVVGFDSGLLLPEMNCHDNQTDTIKIIGNVSKEGNVEPEKDIYANVWFRLRDNEVINTGEHLNFQMDGENFYNWEEEPVKDVKAWDAQY